MILYKRTLAGSKHVLDPFSSLPRKLRTLLIAIDGKTSRDAYVHNLSSFGDVPALLDSLELQGYIASVRTGHTSPSSSVSSTHLPLADSNMAEQSTQPSFPSGSVDSALESTNTANSGMLMSRVLSSNPAQPNLASFPRIGASPGNGQAPSSEDYQLRSAISLMSDFIFTYLPADSLEIVLALEGLGSIEQAIASLNGYQAMIVPAGDVAIHHMAELRASLNNH